MKRITKILFCAGMGAAMLASCQKELPHQKKVSIDKPAELSLSIDGVDEVIGLLRSRLTTFT